MAEAGYLEGVLDDLDDAAEGETVSIREVVSAFEHSSSGAIIALFGMVAAMPLIGDIPGMSIMIGLIVLIILAQVLFRSERGLWLPGFIANRKVEAETVEKSIEKVRPYVRWLDKWIKPRLKFLTEGSGPRTALVIGAAIMAVALMPMELIPSGSTLPALAIVAFGLALIARDGAFALFGYAMIIVTLIVAYTVAS